MAWHPGTLVIVAPLFLLACVTRAPGETTAGDATETTGGTTSPGSTTTGPSDPTPTSATASPGGTTTTTTGEACDLVVGPSDEPPVPDPDGCFAIADEAGCKAMACTALFGVPAECADSQWCVRDREASVFLGCRPFTICKLWGKVVCVADELGTHAFYTMSCTPMGFGRCEPGFDFDGSEPPPACD